MFQIKSMEIIEPVLERDSILKVIEGLKSSPHLERLTITNPAAFNGLPHHTTLRFIKLTGLPQYCQDWQWLKLNENMEDIEVLFTISKTQSSSDGKGEESIHVKGEMAEIYGMTMNGAMKILDNLPCKVGTKVKHDFLILIIQN